MADAMGPAGETIELLETIRVAAQGAKVDLMRAACKENTLWQALTRYQDLVQHDIETFRDIGDRNQDAKVVKDTRNEAKKQKLAIGNAKDDSSWSEITSSSQASALDSAQPSTFTTQQLELGVKEAQEAASKAATAIKALH